MITRDDLKPCRTCDGTGEVEASTPGYLQDRFIDDCPDCGNDEDET